MHTLVGLLQVFDTTESLGLPEVRVKETQLTGKKNGIHKRYSFLLGYRQKGLISNRPYAEESQTDSRFAEAKQLSFFVSFSWIFFFRT